MEGETLVCDAGKREEELVKLVTEKGRCEGGREGDVGEIATEGRGERKMMRKIGRRTCEITERQCGAAGMGREETGREKGEVRCPTNPRSPPHPHSPSQGRQLE